jgi:hypothetical protein
VVRSVRRDTVFDETVATFALVVVKSIDPPLAIIAFIFDHIRVFDVFIFVNPCIR